MASKVNYNDKRFTTVEKDKSAALKESDKTYDSIINNSDKYYQQQIDAANQWGETQKQLQQEQTDFAIDKIEQQKDQAHKDYLKEQTGAYVDWQRQSNQYGSNAEKQASSGLAHTGYSESSQVSMYNAYQNRVATARESYSRAVLNYDNAIKDARLQNNSALAEIAYQTLQKSLELSLQGFQYKNQLVLDKAKAKRDIDNTYYSRYQDVLSQINHEISTAEQVRQYNESLALQREQFEWQKKKSNVSSGGGGSSRRGSGGGSGGGTLPNPKPDPNPDDDSLKDDESTVSANAKLNLGYGPISDDQVKKMVKNEQVKAVKINGKDTLVRTASAPSKLSYSNKKATTKFIIDAMMPGALGWAAKKKK